MQRFWNLWWHFVLVHLHPSLYDCGVINFTATQLSIMMFEPVYGLECTSKVNWTNVSEIRNHLWEPFIGGGFFCCHLGLSFISSTHQDPGHGGSRNSTSYSRSWRNSTSVLLWTPPGHLTFIKVLRRGRYGSTLFFSWWPPNMLFLSRSAALLP